MSLPLFRSGLLAAALLMTGMLAHGGIASFTDRGKTDFDTALQLLNPYGTWSKVDGLWAYTPLDHQAPYTHGRWIYTEYGWYWKGSRPESWATEHYGYWKRSAARVWSWFPGPYWLPQTVEMRITPTHIGWRSAEVDQDGNFVEQPLDRYSKPDEWSFVTRAQFAQPITPAVIVQTDVAGQQLEDSTDSFHTYMTYRAIDRPGPHPADFVAFAGSEAGMFPPRTMQDRMAAQLPPSVVAPGFTSANAATNNAPARITGTNAPTLLGTGDDSDPTADRRQVKYWITMSLPTYWTPPPDDAKPQEIYLYHPDFYQDNDGIERRVTLWFNPYTRTRLQDVIAENTPVKKPAPGKTAAGPATPAVPALPASAGTDEAGHAFRSPLDESFHPAAPAATSANVQGAASKAPVPSGLKNNAPVPSGATNAP